VKSSNISRIARTFAVVCAAGLATAASVLGAGPAQAATGEHCMIVLPDAAVVRCFDTFDQARQFAESAGAVGPSKGGSDTARALRSAANLTLLSVEYDLPGWNILGATRWVYGTAGPCSGTVNDIDYSLNDWADSNFDQRISSFLMFNNCWSKHYDLVNFGGLAVGYQGSQAVINAALNNDTSSERWS
jgi:hypothetical protein